MKIIEGGVCAAQGFTAGSIRCGIKESRTNDDTAIIFSACECTAGGDLYHEPRQGGACLCHHGASGKRRGTCNHRQFGKCQCLRTGRYGERPPYDEGGIQAARRGRGGYCRRVHRRNWSAAAGRAYRGASARDPAGEKRFGKGYILPS